MSRLAQRIAAGAGWLYGYRWLERLLDLGSLVVLARLLSPEDFGLVAIAASVAAIIEGLAAFDVAKALIRSRDEERSLFDSAWTLSALRGLLAALVMAGAAPFVSDGRIGAVLWVLAFSPLIAGLSNPRFVLFERDLEYAKVALLTLGAKVASFLVTVSLALWLRSYWALVAGILASTLASTLLSYTLKPYRPRPSLARAREIFAFSGWLSATTLVTTLAMETDKLIVGRLLGVGDTGRYFMTQKVGVLPTRELVSPLQRILFPSFSALVEQPERLKRAVIESINVVAGLSIPAGCGFALVAADFVPLALGPGWEAIVPLLAILVPYLGLRATLSMTLPCVMALGRVQLLFWVSLVYALVHIPVFVGATALYGLTGSIWSLVAAGVLYSWLNAWLLKRTLGITLGEILGQLWRPLLATALMVAAVLGAAAALKAGAPDAHRALSLAGQVIPGALVYAAALYGLWRAAGRPAGLERRLLQLRERS